MSEVRGYKVFNEDWTCSPSGNTKQYTCPGKYEEDISPVRCGKGMHFCKKAADCFNYYSFDSKNKVVEVVAYGDIAEEGDKCCTEWWDRLTKKEKATIKSIPNFDAGKFFDITGISVEP